MSIELAGLVLSGISTLSGIVQAYKAVKGTGQKLDVQAMLRIMASQKVSQNAAFALAQVIDDDLLGTLLGNIERKKNDLLIILGDDSIPEHKKDRAADEADSVICDQLRRIKRYNQRTLPDTGDEDLYIIWQRHNCG